MFNRILVNRTILKYGLMAVAVVLIELFIFWLINSIYNFHYLVATIVSLVIGIILNWIGSRIFVFGPSKYSLKKEFTLVFISSSAGIIMQSVIVVIFVEKLHSAPLLGKSVAIIITFFWNYYIRKKYIYQLNDK